MFQLVVVGGVSALIVDLLCVQLARKNLFGFVRWSENGNEKWK